MPSLRANGTELFYEFTGPERAPTVVFSNSLGASLEMWDAQMPVLAGRYRCLRYDVRGHGRSVPTERNLTIGDLADDVLALMEELGVARADVVGLSLGGMTAQALAAKRPERVGRLVLMATSAHMPPAQAWRDRAETVRREGPAAIADAVLARWFTAAFRETHDETVAPLRERFCATDAGSYAACCEAIAAMDLRADAARIALPTLLLAGADDPATPPAMLADLQARIAGSELVVLPRAAHLLNVEQADETNRRLAAFLAPAA